MRMQTGYDILYKINLKRGGIPRHGRGFSLENRNEKDYKYYMEIDLVVYLLNRVKVNGSEDELFQMCGAVG